MKKLLAAMFVALLMVGCGDDIEVPKLIKCDGCKKGVSSSADDCPNCGHPVADSVDAYVEERKWAEELAKIIAEAISEKMLETRGEEGEELAYAPDQQPPYTGWAKQMNDNGQITSLSQYKDGKLDGMGIGWYGNGQKKLENAHKDGKLITAFSWKANGEKCPVTNVVNGNGVWVWYNLAGQKFWSLTYKDGVKVDAKLGEGVKHLTD